VNDTPRTDAEEYDIWEGDDYAVNVVPSSFARALERELADATMALRDAKTHKLFWFTAYSDLSAQVEARLKRAGYVLLEGGSTAEPGDPDDL
jgi:hypothetical protein